MQMLSRPIPTIRKAKDSKVAPLASNNGITPNKMPIKTGMIISKTTAEARSLIELSTVLLISNIRVRETTTKTLRI